MTKSTKRNQPKYKKIFEEYYNIIFEEYYNITIPKGYVIHHIDGEQENNNINNLLCCLRRTHTRYHTQKSWVRTKYKFILLVNENSNIQLNPSVSYLNADIELLKYQSKMYEILADMYKQHREVVK